MSSQNLVYRDKLKPKSHKRETNFVSFDPKVSPETRFMKYYFQFLSSQLLCAYLDRPSPFLDVFFSFSMIREKTRLISTKDVSGSNVTNDTVSRTWKVPTNIMKFAGIISDETANKLRKFEKETDKVYEST